MPRLFGTDGVRGVANRDLTPDLALALGRAAGLVLAPGGGSVVVGRDTRASGPMLEAALVAGLCSAGVEVLRAGIVPSPAVAYFVLAEGAQAGAVVSASHNPVPDNGIKFFSAVGAKVPTEVEDSIEAQMASEPDLPEGTEIGDARPLEGATDRYLDHLLSTIDRSLDGLRVVLDCAFGAAFEIAPAAFERAGAEVVAINAEPDGSRINVDCGSTALEGIAKVVEAEGADFGLAFDGDADRVLAVDETGAPVDGDSIIGVVAQNLLAEGALAPPLVVTTVMSNLGFVRALEARGIDVQRAQVGDRHVAEMMASSGAALGGEQSGHVIFGAHSTTGDGILTGLQLARVLAVSGDKMSALAHFFEPYPQILINVRVADRGGLEGAEPVWAEVARAEAALGAEGRVLLRASGTEPVVRVMVEAADQATASETATALAETVRRELGA